MNKKIVAIYHTFLKLISELLVSFFCFVLVEFSDGICKVSKNSSSTNNVIISSQTNKLHSL